MEAHEQQGAALPDLMKQSLGLAQEYIRNPEQFGRQLRNGVMAGRIQLKEGADLNNEKVSAFVVRDAGTVERELVQQRAEENDASMEH